MNTHTKEVTNYFNIPESYLKNGFDIVVRKKIIDSLLGTMKNKHILDMGCGNGVISMNWVAQNEVEFVDIAENMLKIVQNNFNQLYPEKKLLIQHSSLDNFKSTKSYDVILAIGLLAHLENTPKGLDKLSSLLAPGGKLVLQLTDYDQFLSQLLFKIKSLRPAYHQTKKTQFSRLKKQLIDHKLQIKAIVNYSMMLPGLGLFSDSIKQKVQLWSIHKSFSLDKIVLLEKSE